MFFFFVFIWIVFFIVGDVSSELKSCLCDGIFGFVVVSFWWWKCIWVMCINLCGSLLILVFLLINKDKLSGWLNWIKLLCLENSNIKNLWN